MDNASSIGWNMDFLKYLEKIIRKFDKNISYPRIIRMFRFSLGGVKFNLSNPVEAYRVLGFGGEEDFTREILNSLKKEDVFFDIGACVGLVSIHAAFRCREVYSFEPHPLFQERLLGNIALNGLPNVFLIRWAVTEKGGTIDLFANGVDGSSPSIVKTGDRWYIKVESKNLDVAISEKELPFPDVIKLDIEGAEFFALKGMNNLLMSKRAPRKIFIEIHPTFLSELGVTTEHVVDLVEGYGYQEIFKQVRNKQLHCIYTK